MVISVLSAIILFVPALLLSMASDSCGATSCNMTVFELGFYIAVFGPAIVTILGIIFSIRALVKKQSGLNYALIGMGGTYGAFLLGVAIIFITASAGVS